MASFLSRPLTTTLVTLLIAIYVWLGWSATLDKGPAYDEVAHLTAGYSYWKFNDYRLQPENGNLPQRWAGLVATSLAPKLDPQAQIDRWSESDVWSIAHNFLYEQANPVEMLLAAGRGAMIGWGAATCLLVYAWSRSLWGSRAGLLSLALCASSPTLLAHGPMITSDMTATFCLLAATWTFWRYLEGRNTTRLAVSLFATGLAVLAKFSWVLLPPIFLLLITWHFLATPRAIAALDRPSSRLRCLGLRILALTTAHSASALLFIWVAFGARYAADAEDLPAITSFYIPWNELLPDAGLRRSTLLFLKNSALLPEAYTHGFAYVLYASDARGAFAAGEFSSSGWWWFFPYAFLLKSTWSELVLTVILIGAAGRRLVTTRAPLLFLERHKRFAPLAVFILVYGIASVTSNLNIGHRHILPLYIPLFIVAGFLGRKGTSWAARCLALFLAGLQCVQMVSAFPNYLTYFNSLAGHPDRRWNHLVDSSLDWGQELPSLARWLAANRTPDEPVYLSYFGVADPRRDGINAAQFAPYSSFWSTPRLARLEPGLYCVSATMLQDCYSPFAGSWNLELEKAFQALRLFYEQNPAALFADDGYALRSGTSEEHRRWVYERLRYARLVNYLRLIQPISSINNAMFVYRLNAAEVSLAVDAPASTWARMIEKAHAERIGIKGAP